MQSRGRKSAAEIAVIGPSGIETVARPKPPSELNDEEASEWREIVNSLPADWVGRETFPLAVQLCRCVVRARRVAQLLEAYERDAECDVKAYRDLLRTEAELSRTIAALTTKMRISQQSTYDKSKKKPTQGKRPWE